MNQISELEFYRKHVEIEKDGDSFKIINVRAMIYGDVEGSVEGNVGGGVWGKINGKRWRFEDENRN